MKRTLVGIILGAGALAARVMCNAGVYSQSVGSFFPNQLPTNEVSLEPIVHNPDEVEIASSGRRTDAARSLTEWYVSTNILLRQPNWDGDNDQVPLSVAGACALARASVSRQYPGVSTWKIDSLWLRPVPWNGPATNPVVWCYDIEFTPKNDGQAREFDNVITNCSRQVILLDGTVVTPKTAKSRQGIK